MIDEFNDNCYIMVVVSDNKIRKSSGALVNFIEPNAIELSILGAKRYFENNYDPNAEAKS